MTPTNPEANAGRTPQTRGAAVVEIPEEAPPIVCNLVAAGFSFIVLTALRFVADRYFGDVSPALESAWVLLLALLPFGTILLDAAAGAAALLVIAVAAQLLLRIRRFPDWLPLVLAWPSALVLVVPSALEHADEWAPWLLLGVLAAAVFCFHWLAFLLAREAWD